MQLVPISRRARTPASSLQLQTKLQEDDIAGDGCVVGSLFFKPYSSVPSMSSQTLRRSQARPFKLPFFSTWWQDARQVSAQPAHSLQTSRENLVSEEREDAKVNEGRREETEFSPGQKQCVLSRLGQQFASASFWAIDGHCVVERARRASGSSITVASSRSSDSDTVLSEEEKEVLPPIFRLPLKYSCNLTLVGKRLCNSDLLLRPLAVVHTPHQALCTSELFGPDDEQKHETKVMSRVANEEEVTRCDQGRRDHQDAPPHLRDDAGSHVYKHGRGGISSENDSSVSCPPRPFTVSPRGGLYLRHITLNTPASSWLDLSFKKGGRTARIVGCRPCDSAGIATGGVPAAERASSSTVVPSSSPGAANFSAPSDQAWGPAFSYGLLLVQLPALPESVRDDVLKAAKPFGAILEDNGVRRRVCIDRLLHIHISSDFFEDDDGQLQKSQQDRPTRAEGRTDNARNNQPRRNSSASKATDVGKNSNHDCVRPKGCTCVYLESAGGKTDLCTFGRWSLIRCDDTPAARVLEILNSPLILHAASALDSRQTSEGSCVPGSRCVDSQHEEGSNPHEVYRSKARKQASGASEGGIHGKIEEDRQEVGKDQSPSGGGKLCSRRWLDNEHSKYPAEHLRRVCLCSAQECPLHAQWLQIPIEWAPPLPEPCLAVKECRLAGSEQKDGGGRSAVPYYRGFTAVKESGVNMSVQGENKDGEGTAGIFRGDTQGYGGESCSGPRGCFNCGSELCVENFSQDVAGSAAL